MHIYGILCFFLMVFFMFFIYGSSWRIYPTNSFRSTCIHRIKRPPVVRGDHWSCRNQDIYDISLSITGYVKYVTYIYISLSISITFYNYNSSLSITSRIHHDLIYNIKIMKIIKINHLTFVTCTSIYPLVSSNMALLENQPFSFDEISSERRLHD